MRLDSTISNYASSQANDDCLVNLNTFLNSNETIADVTVWGTRVIYRDRFEGYVSIDAIAQIVIQMGFDKSPKLSDEERVAGMALVHKLRDYYNRSDLAASEKNFLIRIVLFIRDLFVKHFTNERTTRYRISEEGWAMYYFRGYQEVDFKEKFPDVKMDDKFGSLILATEHDIRGLLVKV